MAKNKKNDYFALLCEQAAFSVHAAELLEQILCNFHSEESKAVYARMHEIEHEADKLHHDILTRLSTEFITPIDQEDILRLVQIIDDITDAVDEVTLDFYMYDIKTLPSGADQFAGLVLTCIKALYAAIGELKNFKKPEKLRQHIIATNHAEGEADKLYTESIHRLFVSAPDTKTLIGQTKVFESLENCCDLCEHASDVIEQIVIKNT